MSLSVGNGPVGAEKPNNVNTPTPESVEHIDKDVKRGFSTQNSYSRTEGNAEAPAASQVAKPQLDKPTPKESAAEPTKGVLKGFEEEAKKPLTESMKEGFQGLKKPPLKGVVDALQGKKTDLVAMGFSEAQIDGLMSMADPNDPDNAMSPMHSASARVKDFKLETGSKMDKLFTTFADVSTKMSLIKEIPKELKAELEADFEKLAKLATSSAAKGDLDVDTATTLLMQIQNKMQDERIKFEQETIKIGRVAKEQASNERIEKIRESIEKANDQKKSDSCGKVFSYIAVAFMAIATVAMVATGAGALAVGLMVTALALTVMMTVSSETNNFMMKMFGDSMGAQIGAMVFWTSVMIILTLGASAASTGASTAANAANLAKAGSSAGATVTASGTSTAATAATTASRATQVATKVMKLARVGQGAASIGDGSSKIASSVYGYQAEQLKAEALQDKAFMLRLQQQMDDAMESIQKAIDELQAGYQVVTNIMKANHETKTTLSRNMRA